MHFTMFSFLVSYALDIFQVSQSKNDTEILVKIIHCIAQLTNYMVLQMISIQIC